MALEAETGVFLSLADLADLNTDEISTLTSRVPLAGIYHCKVTTAEGKQGEEKDGKPAMIRFNYAYEVMSAQLVDKTADTDIAGKILRESYPIWNKDENALKEAIGLLKGRYQKVGLVNSGRMGGDPNKEPGWIDGGLGAEVDIQVRVGIKDGEPRAYFDWLAPDAKAIAKAAAQAVMAPEGTTAAS